MLRLVSKTICLSLIGLFNPLEAFQKHQKDGFFIEAGFETGLLEGEQTKEETTAQNTQNTRNTYENPLTHPQTKEQPKEQNKSDTATPQSVYGRYYILQNTILEKATELFTAANINGNGLTFYSQSPVYVMAYNKENAEFEGYGNNSVVVIQNFLPYNLNNIELSYTDAQGKAVNLGVIETIPKDSQIILPASLFNNFSNDSPFNSEGLQQLQTTTTPFSDANTQSLFEKLSQITTNLQMTYENTDPFSSGNNDPNGPLASPKPHYECPGYKKSCQVASVSFTPQTAEELTNLMLDMIAVFDSKSWEEAVLNAPFQFSNSPSECGIDYPKCVNPFNNGLVDPKDEKYALTPEEVINSYRVANELTVNLLNAAKGFLGLGSQLGSANAPGDDGFNQGVLGIAPFALDPEKLFGKNLNKVAILALRDIIHEYGHTLGYTHNGNMTYQRVRLCQEGNGPEVRCEGGHEVEKNGKEELEFSNGHEVRDHDGYDYDVCSRFGGKNQPAFPSNYPNSIYTNCAQVPAGLIGVTTAVWQQLINQNALPINFANLNSQTSHLNAGLNVQNFATSMVSTIVQNFSTTSTTTYHSSSKNFRSPILGANVKIGYQHYFNDYIGLAYYGIIKYNYAQANDEKIQQLSYGGGMDVLFDFITTYINKKQNHPTKKVFASSFGVFGGLRGLYNSYYVFNQVKGSGNLDIVTGFNYRYKHSKYSVGISVPLIQSDIKIASNNGIYADSVILNEGGSHFKVFFNYGWVF
ncbi:outer membrane beta-barrel protein [Helicobacter pylori]|uniref:Outer membrane protein n=1 Tax=Helicobacter pylori HP260AFii TaxID=1159077 RepID=A0ABC9SA01_HELPX|nr:outer membrane beta-barrel protein [Helicobacter pylori]EMH16962.1 outer membrane protein [Helicobacter pylori GAM260ASi]EMH31451.1 outer membrane protein [Helicobacter pylori GAM268Bii]EMH66940.1 outer membrane protein [Helicobacter pylori HP260AFii]EMH68946.1 outer membrane protein [Helicobacter pylori HP260ASii]